ncbi:MAG: glycosyltransferase [Verrucomicrobiota bacterium]
MTGHLVSILIPTYKRPELLALALASALQQTYKNLQIIVRDNASGDLTPEVVRSFVDPRIEFHQASETIVAWQNFCECALLARGKYVLPLCDDDMLGENYVATLVGFMEKDPQILAAYGATHTIDEEGTTTATKAPQGTLRLGAREVMRAWCDGRLPIVSAIHFLCLRSFFLALADRINFPMGHNSDNAICMAAAIRGKVLFTEQCVFYYRIYRYNSWRSFSLELRAQGDSALLSFLDDEVNSVYNEHLTAQEWITLRRELTLSLASARYSMEIMRLTKESVRRGEERDRVKAKLARVRERELILRDRLAIAEKKSNWRKWLPKW